MATVNPQSAPEASSGSATPRTVPASVRRTHPPRTSPGFPLGEWVFIPRTEHFLGSSSDAYIERGDERVPLVHCSSELEQFTREMAGIEGDFTRRCSGIDPAAPY
ncbi:hypothetical protein ACFYXS_29360 [Streptomyces sp. NPDC002574]|uniref:hypothetical protein n=1 Tax=Streptomyces sp. NPDC002574 TaxID=3364652 RepID=UPI0036AFCABE